MMDAKSSSKDNKDLQREIFRLKKENEYLKGELNGLYENSNIDAKLEDYKIIFDHMPAAVVVTNLECTEIVYSNKLFQDSLRLKEGIKNVDLISFFHPEFIDSIREINKRRCVGDFSDFQRDAKIVLPGNKEVWVKFNSSVIEIKGQLLLLILIKNINEEKLRVEELKDAEYMYRALFTESAIVNLLVDAESEYVIEANISALEYFQYSQRGIRQKKINELFRLSNIQVGDINIQQYYPEVQPIHTDGQSKIGELYISKIKYKNRNVILYSFRDITNKKKIERALVESESQYRAIVDNSYDGIYIYRGDEMLFANNKIFELSGYSPDVFKNKSFWDIVHPDDKASIKKIAADREAGKKVSNTYQARVLCNNGIIKECEFSVAAIKYLGEYAAIGVVRDISDRIKAEREVKESEEKYRYITENSIDIVWQFDTRMQIKYVSPSLTRILDYKIEDWIGVPIWKFMRWNDFAHFARIVLVAMQQPELHSIIRFETHIIHNAKKILVPVEVNGKFLFDESKRVIGAQGVLRDITEKRELTQALEESAATYKAIFGNTGTSICIVKSNGEMILFNKKFEELSGYTHKSLVGKKLLFDLVVGYIKVVETIEEIKQPILVTQKESFIEHFFVNKRNMAIPVIFNIQKIEGRDSYVISFQDISKRKVVESQLKKLNEELELRVQKRTEQLSEANKSKSEFLANMSHEIRTPINAILGFAELLSKKLSDPTEVKYLQSILVSGKNLLSLINDTLDLSKIEAGKLDLFYSSANILNILEELKHMFKLKVENKGIYFIVNVNNNLKDKKLTFELDENRLKQILINLVNNAVKFTEDGYVKVNLIINDAGDKKADLIIQVEDTGIGISQGFISKIFDPFVQEDSSFENNYGGTGLGLSISMKLVELMHGAIDVESEVGVGSTFTIQLKSIEISDFELENVGFLTKKDLYSNIEFKNATILIVDDVLLNREYLINVLKQYKFNLLVAKNGEEAWDIICLHKPDLVITDLKMPIKDGFSLQRDLQNNKDYKDIPVIAATALANKASLQKIKSFRFSSYILKPFSVEEVINQLVKFLPHSKVEKKEVQEDALSYPVNVESGIKKYIQKEIIPLWKKIVKRQSRAEVILFGNKLLELGEKNDQVFFVELGEDIISCMEDFDVSQVLSYLSWFEKFAKENNLT
jgi:PAS domain S-box-containing protein